jgi:quercetin dioxygenase-like cupin family protein
MFAGFREVRTQQLVLWTALLISGVTTIWTVSNGVAAREQQSASQTRREPQFENDHVRVWKSVILPNQPLALHRHDHGRTIVALKGGTLDVVDAKGETIKKMTWETGKAYWLDVDPAGEQHGDLNRGDSAIEVIVVEMRQ